MKHDAEAKSIAVDFRGSIPNRVKDYATEKLSRLERYAPRPILHAKVEVTEEANPAIATPITVKASIDVNGNVLHASVSGRTPEEAIDLMADRLRRQIERIHDAHDHKPSHRGRKKTPNALSPAVPEPLYGGGDVPPAA